MPDNVSPYSSEGKYSSADISIPGFVAVCDPHNL